MGPQWSAGGGAIWPKKADYPDLPFEVWVVRRDDMGKVIGALLVQRFRVLDEARLCRDTSDRAIVDREHFEAELIGDAG
jgi:hypothetical protein